MPKLDGWGLLRRLKDDYRTKEVPFALLSNQDDYRESLQALNTGAQAYFAKTTRLEILAQKVHEMMVPRRTFQSQLAAGELNRVNIRPARDPMGDTGGFPRQAHRPPGRPRPLGCVSRSSSGREAPVHATAKAGSAPSRG